ncbi:hypothetical protein AN478_01395 [Thiohalorhabdus denitrificans]|nr:hypothetical protein [Thiohalorhabdus denitrificans]KPV41748.1 hypothetical protein AN478_01395 [Thiohalorhabdus denitrificans]
MVYADLLVHVDKDLEAEQGRGLASALEKRDGVAAARFHPRRSHLLQVWYDPQRIPAGEILGAAREGAGEARLVAL